MTSAKKPILAGLEKALLAPNPTQDDIRLVSDANLRFIHLCVKGSERHLGPLLVTSTFLEKFNDYPNDRAYDFFVKNVSAYAFDPALQEKVVDFIIAKANSTFEKPFGGMERTFSNLAKIASQLPDGGNLQDKCIRSLIDCVERLSITAHGANVAYNLVSMFAEPSGWREMEGVAVLPRIQGWARDNLADFSHRAYPEEPDASSIDQFMKNIGNKFLGLTAN